ncbi:hypothetical protein [Methylomonas sp. MgM2]
MQNTSQILDVVIGLVSIYLLLSLICSALTESVEKQLKRRSKDLSLGLFELFGGNKTGADFLDMFYKNPIIFSMYKGRSDISFDNKLKIQGELPSYIDPKTFSMALINQLLDGESIEIEALKKSLSKAALPANVKAALETLIGAAGNNLNQAINNIEDWYSAMGDRVGGWYKRHTQLVTFLIATALTLAGNIDTIAIAKSLMVNDNLRADMVKTAFVMKDESISCAPAETNDQCLDDKVEQLNKRIQRIQNVGMPLGWTDTTGLRSAPEVLEKCLGLLITIMASSVGAPFWFDLLNKFINIRSTIKPQAPKPMPGESRPSVAAD